MFDKPYYMYMFVYLWMGRINH